MTKGLQRSLSRAPHGRLAGADQKVPRRLEIQLNTTVTVSATGVAIGWGTVVIGDIPEGNILILGAVGNIIFAGSGSDANLVDTWEGNYGIGSTPADDATITGADVDMVPDTDIPAATAEVAPAARGALAAPVTLDNTDGSLEINLNVLIDAADITDDQSVILTVTGTVDLSYQVLGDD